MRNIPVVPFGELVRYKQVRKTKAQEGKLDSEWRCGIWLGHTRSSNEVLIGTPEGGGQGIYGGADGGRKQVECREDCSDEGIAAGM